VIYRQGNLNSAIDWHRPYQVPLPAYRCLGHNYLTMHFFCEPLSLSPRTRSFRKDGQDITVFCFADRKHTEQFRERFGGEFMNAKDRPDWRAPGAHRDFSLADHQRNGRCVNLR
jgi:hypothetical protein